MVVPFSRRLRRTGAERNAGNDAPAVLRQLAVRRIWPGHDPGYVVKGKIAT
jgi:hypothetical protein